MGWPRRLTALGGGGAGESLAPDSACACVTTGGGTASASIPTGGSLCACVTVSGGIAGTLAACLCATVSGGTVDAQVTCATLTASGGAATPRVACACATVSGGVANAPTTCVCATVSGGTANAQVSCRCATQSGGTATGNTSLTAFANGYAARRRVVLEAMPDLPSATLTDFPQPIPGALLAGLFKDAAHGGKVQSSAGWDIRVETGGDNATGAGGTQLDHHPAAYDPAAGTPFIFARHQRHSASREVLFIYYGKAGLSATEADPAGTWSAALAARFWPSGADVRGHLSFTAPFTNVTTTGVTIAGLPGARMVAASYARLDPVPAGNAIDNVSAVTNHYLAKFTSPFPSDGNGERIGTGPGTADFSQFVATGVFSSGWTPETAAGVRNGQNNSVKLNDATLVDAGNVHSWHFTNQSGQNCHIWRDGVQLATTFNGGGGANTSGTLRIDGTENDSFGAGTGAQTTAIPGDYGPSIIYSTVPSQTWIAAYDRCLLDPLAWMGLGAEELPGDAAGSPVAMPTPATVTAGVQTDIDVAAPAYVPSGATAPTLSTVGTAADGGGPAHGSVSAASGKARLLEAAAYSGPDRFGFTLSASGKLLVPARSIITVQPSIAVPGGDPWMDDTSQWATIPPLSAVSSSNIVYLDSNADLARLNPGTPGKHYVLRFNATGRVTITARGTQAAPIVVRGDYDGVDRTQFRKWTNGGNPSLTIDGAAHVYITKIAWVGSPTAQPSQGSVWTTGAATRISIERCWSYGADVSSGGRYDPNAFACDSTTNIRYYRIRYCEHGHPSVHTGTGHWTMSNPTGASFPQFVYLYRNLITDVNGPGAKVDPKYTFGCVLYSIGRGAPSSDMDNKAAFYENRIRSIIANGETIEMKNTGDIIARNTLEQGVDALALRVRQGHNCQMIGNLFVQPTSGGTGAQLELRGYNHIAINNWSVKMGSTGQPTTGSTNGNADFQLWGGNVDAQSFPASKADQASTPRPNAVNCQAGGNRMPITIGGNNGEGGLVLGACLNVVGPNASGSTAPYRNRSQSLGPDGDKDYAGRGQTRASYHGSPAYGTVFGGSTTVKDRAITDADYDEVPTRLFDADVGIACNAYP